MTDDISKVKPTPNWCPACRQRPDALTFCAHPFHRLESAAAPVVDDHGMDALTWMRAQAKALGMENADASTPFYLARFLSTKFIAPVEVEGGMLPDTLGPHAEEWYRLCERRFAVDRIGISGPLAEAIVTAIDTLARQLAEAKAEAEKWRMAEGRAVSELQRELHESNLALREATRRLGEVEGLLRRYRDEVPLGHQPHMIAHLVDAALKEPK